jgi:hypothetical protein
MGFIRKFFFNILLPSLSYRKLIFTAPASYSLQQHFPNATGISRQKQAMYSLFFTVRIGSEITKPATCGEKRQAARNVKFSERNGSEN